MIYLYILHQKILNHFFTKKFFAISEIFFARSENFLHQISKITCTRSLLRPSTIVQCGIGLPVFSPVCYWYLISGDVSKALADANLTDIRDPDAGVLTERVFLQ